MIPPLLKCVRWLSAVLLSMAVIVVAAPSALADDAVPDGGTAVVQQGGDQPSMESHMQDSIWG